MAAPTVETGTQTAAPGGTGTTILITKPTGTVSGNLLIALLVSVSGDASDMSGSGWTHVATAPPSGANNIKVGILYLIAGGSEPADYTFTVSGTNAGRRGGIIRVSGFDSSTVSGATPATDGTSGSTNTSRNYAAVTTAVNDCLLVGCMGWNVNDATYTPDATLSNIYTINRHAGDSKAQAASGSSGTFTGSGNGSHWTSLLWAVRPTPAAGTTWPGYLAPFGWHA